MSVKTRILDDIKEAMRAKDNFKRDTLRMINASLKQVEVDERIELDDDRIFSILQTEIKKRNDSATQYKAGKRDDLADIELNEIDIISFYLPKQLTDDELEVAIQNLIAKNSLSSLKDLGNLMKLAKSELKSSADTRRISQIAKKILN